MITTIIFSILHTCKTIVYTIVGGGREHDFLHGIAEFTRIGVVVCQGGRIPFTKSPGMTISGSLPLVKHSAAFLAPVALDGASSAVRFAVLHGLYGFTLWTVWHENPPCLTFLSKSLTRAAWGTAPSLWASVVHGPVAACATLTWQSGIVPRV